MTNFPTVRLPAMTNPLMLNIRNKFEEYYNKNFADTKKGFYRENDWRRLDWMTGFINQSGSILDVGTGPGAFLNYLTLCGKYSQVVGIDKAPYTTYYEVDKPLDRRIMRVQGMSFPDKSFDTVVCMEVVEHLPLEIMDKGIAELKRVCKKQLIISVPYEEELPLPSYHTKRFDRHNIPEIFPEFKMTLMEKVQNKGVPWAILKADM